MSFQPSPQLSPLSTQAAPAPKRWGVIGAGFVARWFMEAATQLPDVVVQAVASARPSSAAAFAQEHAIPHSYPSVTELLAAPDIDVVYVASPNNLHAEHTVAALQAGKHVLVEKPFAVTPEQSHAMVSAAHSADRLLMEGWLGAFEPGTRVLREQLPQLGTVRRAILAKEQFSSRMHAYREGQLPPAFNPAFAGGSIMDLGVYPVSLAIHLFGPPSRVTATSALLESGVDCQGTIILSYDGDGEHQSQEIVCTHSKTSYSQAQSQIAGEHSCLVFNDCQWPTQISLHRDGADPQDLSVQRAPETLIYELQHFCELLRTNARESALHPLHNSVAAVEVLAQARAQVGVVFP